MLATVVFILCVMVDLIWILHARLGPTVALSSTLNCSSSSFRFGEYRIKTYTFPVPLLTFRSEMEYKWTLKLLLELHNRKHCFHLYLITNWQIYVCFLPLLLLLPPSLSLDHIPSVHANIRLNIKTGHQLRLTLSKIKSSEQFSTVLSQNVNTGAPFRTWENRYIFLLKIKLHMMLIESLFSYWLIS